MPEWGRASFPDRGSPFIPCGHAPRTRVMATQRPSTVRHRSDLFREATAIVDLEYASDLSLDDIARRVASSRRQLQRAYAEIGQTTFREHLARVRMQRAADLLTTGGLTVRQVARRVGYRQPAQFAKAFRRHHGCAPSEYRSTGSCDPGEPEPASPHPAPSSLAA